MCMATNGCIIGPLLSGDGSPFKIEPPNTEALEAPLSEKE
jgi:hypothetical protein